MNTLSLCLICKNEENNIGRLLDSVKGDLFDEIIVVDTGSEDRTVEIVQQYTDKVFFFKWINDFSAARNYSFSHAKSNYILWCDADDIIYPEDYNKLLDLKGRLHEADIWLLKYEYAHDEFGNSICSFFRERIVRRALNLKWEQPIHEYLPLNGSMKKEDIEIHHYKSHSTSGRNIAILEDIVSKDPSNARNVYYLGKELFDNGEIERGRIHLERFTKMPGAWSENKYAAFLKLAGYHQMRKQYEKSRYFCFEAMKLEPLKAEVYCKLGELCMDEQKHRSVIHWYKVAANMDRPDHVLDIIEPKYYTWLPHLQLCLSYNSLGKVREAALHNEIALSFRKQDSRMLNNKSIFKSHMGSDYIFDEMPIFSNLYEIYKDKKIIQETIQQALKSAINTIGKKENIEFVQSDIPKIGWCVANIPDAGTIRIRVLNIMRKLSELGLCSELCSYDTAENYDYIVVGKSYSDKDLQYIKRWKSMGRNVLCDLSEDILEFHLVPDILRECDLIICCSEELRKKVEKINKNVVLIEDAVEYRR